MIQDIAPRRFHIEYVDRQPEDEDRVLVFSSHRLMLRETDNITFIKWGALQKSLPQAQAVYLFAIDERPYFYVQAGEDFTCPKGWRMAERQEFRRLRPKHLAFAAATAFHLEGWYTHNRYCGVCAAELVLDKKERMLRCPCCNHMIYPRINPAVIVGVISGNRLLMTKYNGRAYKNYALVAGFNEVGETLEDTVRREVMEETGLRVKNIRYYKSQPWAFSDNILVGYFCDLDGSDRIHMDEEELSVALWMEKEDLPIAFDDISLTNEMICAFQKM